MNILVAVASKHGSTRGIAEAIAEELLQANHKVTVQSPEMVESVAGYDAVLIGSAIYMGSWMSEASDFVAKYEQALAAKPVWLFSSGPLGAENPQPEGDPAQLNELMAKTGASGHRNFVGSLDKDSLGFGEKLIVRTVKAPYGDFREWDVIRAWAGEIAAALEAERRVAQ